MRCRATVAKRCSIGGGDEQRLLMPVQWGLAVVKQGPAQRLMDAEALLLQNIWLAAMPEWVRDGESSTSVHGPSKRSTAARDPATVCQREPAKSWRVNLWRVNLEKAAMAVPGKRALTVSVGAVSCSVCVSVSTCKEPPRVCRRLPTAQAPANSHLQASPQGAVSLALVTEIYSPQSRCLYRKLVIAPSLRAPRVPTWMAIFSFQYDSAITLDDYIRRMQSSMIY